MRHHRRRGHSRRHGAVEAIRALMVARRSARAERTQAINQAARFARHTAAQLAAGLAALRPRPGKVPGYATRAALRELGRRARFPDAQTGQLDELIVPLVTARAPGLLGVCRSLRGQAITPVISVPAQFHVPHERALPRRGAVVLVIAAITPGALTAGQVSRPRGVV